MKALEGLEGSLNDVFGKSAPQLPKGFKDFLVNVAPWLSLIGGIFGLLAALSIFNWVNKANNAADYVNNLSKAYGGTTIVNHSWSLALYLAVAVLLITSILYILAFTPLRKYKKNGWDYLFYGLILNLIYGVIIAFTTYGTFSNFIGALIGSAIGAYILFQIRDYYIGKAKLATAPVEKPEPKTKK